MAVGAAMCARGAPRGRCLRNRPLSAVENRNTRKLTSCRCRRWPLRCLMARDTESRGLGHLEGHCPQRLPVFYCTQMGIPKAATAGCTSSAHCRAHSHRTWPRTTPKPQAASAGLAVGRLATAVAGRHPTDTTTAPTRPQPALSPTAAPCPDHGRWATTAHQSQLRRPPTTPGGRHITHAAYGAHGRPPVAPKEQKQPPSTCVCRGS